MGCRQLQAPSGGWVQVDRSSLTAVMGCNATDERWHLTCSSTRWSGPVTNNCSNAPISTGQYDQTTYYLLQRTLCRSLVDQISFSSKTTKHLGPDMYFFYRIYGVFLNGPEYEQIKRHSGANDLVVEKRRKTDITILSHLG